MLEISVSCDGRDPPAAFNDKVAASEAAGASTLWLANHLFQRDPVTLAAMALAQTQRIRVALMAVSPFTMHPVQAAMAAATLDEFFPSRVTLCFGVGAPADLGSVSVEAKKPLRAMREAIDIARALFSGETVRVDGESFRVAGRRLASGRRDIPIVLAASGPQMLELAGAAADGVLISAGASVPFVRWTLEHVRRGAQGRAIRTHGLVYAAIEDDERRAHDRLRRILAILLRGPHHAPNLDLAGSVLDQAALREAVADEDWPRAEALITDDIVARHAASGSAEQVCARIAAYHAAGLDDVIIAGARDGAQIGRIMQASRMQGDLR